MRLNGLVKQRRIVTNLLRQTGFSCVAEAEDGVKALRKLEIGDYQFIVSDWDMPKMNGLELLKTVRLSPKLRHTPFLLVTTEAHKENIVEAAQAGADGYIAKPYSASTWSEKIESNLQRKATARIRHSCPSRLCTDNTFEQLGRITRQLHEAITALGLEQSLHTSTQEIPDVRTASAARGK